MADGLYAGDTVGEDLLIEKLSSVKNYKTMNGIECDEVNGLYSNNNKRASCSAMLFRDLCTKNGSIQHHEGLPQEVEEDCRKKRCVDRYDSSESSDSGVAVLSCSDCSGSSTASSDITDPGSPFSTASNHSEDSGAGLPPKMPPAQSAQYAPWPWTADEERGSPIKRPLNDKTAFTKRPKTNNNCNNEESPSCLILSSPAKVQNVIDSSPTNNNYKLKRVEAVSPKMQQGKITEYFKTQMKSNGMRKHQIKNADAKISVISSANVPTTKNGWRVNAAAKKMEFAKARKTSTIPRKILPAPSKVQEPSNIHPFAPTMTLTAVSFPSNLAYLKSPKPPDNIFMPQFATINNEKVGTLPIINRNPSCLIQPVQNFVKLNATVVPIVNLNALPPRLNAGNVTLSVDTAVPTVLPARPKGASENLLGKSYGSPSEKSFVRNVSTEATRTEEPYRTEECQTHQPQPQEPPDDKCWNAGNQTRIMDQKSPSPTDSDSGISSLGSLEISVDEQVSEEPKKSPILSQPKTIRFPPVQRQKQKDVGRELGKSPPQSSDSRCRWDECAAQFDTSGALLEHLQVKHVISQSQANQEHYVCLWRGCKVHGRTSCSISWLERHVLAHAGTKPFRCIVDGCGQRFNSQLMLERHVNNHFNSDGTQNTNTKKSVENGQVKLFKRNGRIIRFRRQPWSARMFDFIDSGIMEGIQHKLLCMTQARTLGQIDSSGEVINLQSHILARRTDSKGNKELLVQWHPKDVTPDEWVSEKEYKPTKTVSIPALSPQSREALSPTLFPDSQRRAGQKHRRKPLKSS
ncbi:unnamed protein product [Ceutorhynchus assimilis]|uniref:C2H2-type domain-containing protein n=1 Tax=Ceutorhynchus assimilis TaxID=467358 RepID=A0A9P0DHL9_9CUCU|nr:unnamed protein product [Ceutorhynchus assimilis]